jgi:L-fuconolactonase
MEEGFHGSPTRQRGTVDAADCIETPVYLSTSPMNIDSHQHFWSYSATDYPWIGAGMERLARDYLPVDIKAPATAAGIGGTVAVQARQTLKETRWLLQLAEHHPLIRGVVGWVDLRSTDIGDQLDEFVARKKFVGVRHVVQDETDPRFLLGAEFVRGLRQLAPLGLTYDLLLYPQQLSAAVELVASLPGQPFVLDHLAKPQIATWTKPGDMDPWRHDIAALAKHKNVCCKLSGMVTEAVWRQWRPADFAAYLDVALAAFGPGRLMFGSDWPVCLLSADYAEVAGIVRDLCATLSVAEQTAIWGGTATRFYGLDRASPSL